MPSQSRDDIHSTKSLSELREMIAAAFPDVALRGGESYYRGNHLDGKNNKQTEFSIEDTGSSDHLAETVPQDDFSKMREKYGLALEVSGSDEADVTELFNRLLTLIEEPRT